MSFDWDLFNQLGWGVFDNEASIRKWADYARTNVQERLLLKDFENGQLRCGGTWFVGVNFLNNNMLGGLDQIALEGQTIQAIAQRYGAMFQTWDQA